MTTINSQKLLLRVAGAYFRSEEDLPSDRAFNGLMPRTSPIRNDSSPDARDTAMQQRMLDRSLRELERDRRLDKVVHTVAAAVRNFSKKVDPSSFGGEVSMVRGDTGDYTPEITARDSQPGRAKQAAGVQSIMGKFASLVTSVQTSLEKLDSQGGFTKVLRVALTPLADNGHDQDFSAKARALEDLTDVIKASSADLDGILGIEEDSLVHGLSKRASLLDLATSLRIVSTLMTQLNLAIGRWVEGGEEKVARNCQAVAEQTASYLDSFGDDLGLLTSKMAAEVKAMRSRV